MGEGYGDNLSLILEKYPKNIKWLYLRAKVIASDFVSKSKENDYDIDEKIMYESDCSHEMKNIKVENDATLIFTSPSSVRCFCTGNRLHKNMTIIVIGETTATALPLDTTYILAPKTTIQSCIDIINKI